MNNSQKLFILYLRTKLKLISCLSVKWAARIAFKIFTTPYRKSNKQKPSIFNSANSIKLNVEGQTIMGYCWNTSSTQKILIVHGFESRAYNFESYISPLIDKGLCVYAMDGKAHGLSDGKTITLPEYIMMFQELEKMVGQFDGFIAHSFGGLAVCLYQEQLKQPDSRLVLIAPATETSTSLTLFCKFLKLDEKIKRGIYQLIESASGNSVNYYSLNRIIPKLENKILWIHDEDDEITPISDVSELLLKKQENVEFMITKGLGHRRIYKDPDVMGKVLNFIKPLSL